MPIDDEEPQAMQEQMLALHRRAEMWRQRAEAAEAELAAIPYRQLYDVWHSGDDGYIIKDAEDVAVWLAKWRLKQPVRE